MKVLIVEDEPELSASIVSYLLNEKYQCDTAEDFMQAENKIIDFNYDCVIVDIGLPGGNGLDLIRLVKRMKKNEGIIVISANGALSDKIIGLNLGADDYLAKPFHLSELIARLNAIIRRRNFNGAEVFEHNELRVQVEDKLVFVHDKAIVLNKKELDLLLFLITNRRRVISKSAISQHLSQNESGYYRGYDVVYAHMKNLKRKLADAGCRDYIKTIYGVGYKLDCDEAIS
ncbi:response regulator transcription factor [Mucilaginibacter robiniae]|uniref:Response regulator transcription factor n=1 Tax=Mucilaginibacter robiniae TaxID=2728022 RepID=A0A7L5DYB9_9SPHI|nr:response regulator transcription factor [Mucilaginibacter robiniae]QJD96005.1 response regulator transcription factor [Mucilaginibacter robiniae]